jgi:putative heme-binding domain-containing protein
MQVLESSDAATRNWGVREVGSLKAASPKTYAKLMEMATSDPSPDVRVQIAIAAGRLKGGAPDADPLPLLMALLGDPQNAKDPLIPTITYMNLRPLADDRGKDILAALDQIKDVDKSFGDTTVRWIKQAIASSGRGAEQIVADVKKTLKSDPEPKKAGQALDTLIDSISYLGLDDRAKAVDKDLREAVTKYLESADPAARLPAITIALWWRDAKAVEAARKTIADPKAPLEARTALLKTLAEVKAIGNVESFGALAGDAGVPIRLRQVAIDALGAMGRGEAARVLVAQYAALPAELKPYTVNALTRTKQSASVLLDALEKKTIPLNDVNANHVRSIASFNDKDLAKRLSSAWGTVRTERDPERVKIVEQMRQVVQRHKGDPVKGWAVFDARCAQCHTIYGKGGNVGPDITGVGRDDLTAVLTNVIDPNLVIGKPYYVNVARTKDGDTLAGLLVEESEQQVVLKDQTQTHRIERKNLEKLSVQDVSMMPEGLEKQMTEQEFSDLVAFLLTREPPNRPPAGK